ncbi:MAG: phenylalanine--tRNA ligase subunit beta, partial [Rubricoccaceae bacterium]|nr:phenylalanine--tRNA ligase subunit beta [Rubricoccaceae bacterium]
DVDRGGKASNQISIDIQDAEGCPRYVGLVIRGVTVGPSPEWLKRRLEAIGLRPINNVVDATNFVLHELGQPLHAFDYDLIAGQKIIVRGSTKGETITTLDDEERKLPEGTLLICDAEKPVAIAGVMGGANSEVSERTTNLLLESAYFEPVSIRKAAKALGMQTDASYRFERGVDPTGQVRAAVRAAQLIVEIAGGDIVTGIVDEHPAPVKEVTVTLRPDRVEKVLGVRVPEHDILRLLRSIGFDVRTEEAKVLDTFAESAMREEGPAAAIEEATSGIKLTVPPFRPDIEREIDVIEEIARLWGFDRIPSPATTPVPLIPAGDTAQAQLLDAVRNRFMGLGFRELYTNSLLPKALAEQFASEELISSVRSPVETLNPISQDMAAMRPSLLPGLLGAMSYNQARGAEDLRFIEMGHVYVKSDDPVETVPGYHEHTSLIIGMSGMAQRKGWDAESREVDFFDLKGVLMHVLETLDLPDPDEKPVGETSPLTAYRLALSINGNHLGELARISDRLADQYDLRMPVYFAELNADRLAEMALLKRNERYEAISRFPAVDRDLAVLVDDSQPVGPLLKTIRRSAGDLLEDLRVFDLYRGERIEGGQKSVAFALRFSTDRTLRDEEVDERIRNVVEALEAEHGATLRT